MAEKARLRLKLQNGAEMELEGDPNFIQKERDALLAALGSHPDRNETADFNPNQPPQAWQNQQNFVISWDSVIESKGLNIQLRAKLAADKTNKDACLVLLAAANKLLNLPKPTAGQLAKWLRSSGYPIDRVDRAIAEAITRGDILASGSRRARRYELTGPGKIKAYHLATQLASSFN